MADWLDINSLLTNYRNSLTTQATLGQRQSVDPTRQLLLNTNVNWQTPPDQLTGQNSRGGPSVLSRFFDILSRPRYAVAEATRQFSMPAQKGDNFLEQTGDVLGGALSGLAGTKKTGFGNVISELEYGIRPEQFQKPNDPNAYKKLDPNFKGPEKLNQKSIAGFGLAGDLLLDPLNLVGPGAIKAGIQGARKGIGLASKAPEISELLRPTGISATTNVLPTTPPAKSFPNEFQKLPPGLANSTPEINPIQPGLATESILSPALRNLPTEFPTVPIPRPPIGETNKTIQQLIKDVATQAGEKAPTGVSKMKKQDLIKTLNKVQGVYGPEIVGKLGAQIGGPLPKAAPKLDISSVIQGTKKIDEERTAHQLVDEYAESVLSKPNKFPTLGKNPSVNNPAQQANFFNNKIIPAVRKLHPKRTEAARNSVALRMLKQAENAFESKGMHPTFWSGVPFKLSEVIDRMGGLGNLKDEHLTRVMTALGNEDVSKITNPKLRSTIEGLISEQKLKEVPYVDQALKSSVQNAAVAENSLSASKFDKFKSSILASQKATLKHPKRMINLAPNVPLMITPKTVNLAQNTLKQVLESSTPLPQKAVNKNSKIIQQYMDSNGKTIWSPVNAAVTNAIHQTIGGPTPRTLGTITGSGNNAGNWLLSRIATAHGNKDLRPDVLISQQTAKARAVRRSQNLNQIAKSFNANEIDEAFKAAQGVNAGASSVKTQQLADDFTKSLENLFGSSDITGSANSVAHRTGMLISDINKQLKYMKAGFKFTNGSKVPNLTGGFDNFSKGNDWLNSWKTAKVSEPLVFMSKVQAAIENVVAKNSYLDDFSSRWGTKHYDPKQGFTTKMEDPRLKGLYYPPELASQMNQVLKNWDQIYDPKSPLVKLFDQATSLWKTGMTIYMPAHHIRNLIGDIYLGWMDGVNSTKGYRIAARTMSSQRGRYDGLENVENLVSSKAITTALTRPGDKVLRTKSGLDVTADQLYTAAFNKGLLQSANIVEDIIAEPIRKIKPFKGKVGQGFRAFSEGRDHFAKLAHFADIISKSRNKDLEQVFDEAAKRVRKWHPDGMDLTDFERKYLRRVFPFYSWTRKSLPLIIEGAVLNPAKTMAYPKIMYGLQQMSGIESASIGDPFPEDQLFPDWIKEKGIGPIGAHGMSGIPGVIAGLSRSRPGFDGSQEGYTVANPSNPFIDTISQFAGMGRFKDTRTGIGQMVNPFFRVPAEVGTGQTVLGTPVDYDPNKYITENIPLAAYGSQLGNIGLFGPTERGRQEGLVNNEGLINFLTALGLRGTGASIKQAEFEARERAKGGH